jgi:hypothetical protein
VARKPAEETRQWLRWLAVHETLQWLAGAQKISLCPTSEGFLWSEPKHSGELQVSAGIMIPTNAYHWTPSTR